MEEYITVIYSQFGSAHNKSATVASSEFYTWLNSCIESTRASSIRFNVIEIRDALTDQPIIKNEERNNKQ